MIQVVPTISQDITTTNTRSLMEKKLKIAKVFFKINISTIIIYIPTLPFHIFLSYINLSGENCDTFKHTRTFALVVGPFWFLHLIIHPIITKMKLKRFYDHVIWSPYNRRGLMDFWRRMKFKITAVAWGTTCTWSSHNLSTHYIIC